MGRPSGETTIVVTISSIALPSKPATLSLCGDSITDAVSGKYLRVTAMRLPFGLKAVTRSSGAIISSGGGRRNGNVNGFSPRMNEM